MKDSGVQRDILGRLNGGRRSSFTLRMAPMIDMTFLLLIFFLVAAKWRPKEDFLPFQLPAAQAQQYRIGRPEPLMIYIFATQTGCRVHVSQSGAVQIKDETVEADLALLMEEIRKCLNAQKRHAGDPVEIVCSPEVKWDYLTKIYNMFFGAGLSDITFQMTE